MTVEGICCAGDSERGGDYSCINWHHTVQHFERASEAPNDPKLSDGGGWRAGCTVEERRRQEAASVTAGAVRCSAWLGVAFVGIRRGRRIMAG